MKRSIRCLSLLLVAVMLFSFTACLRWTDNIYLMAPPPAGADVTDAYEVPTAAPVIQPEPITLPNEISTIIQETTTAPDVDQPTQPGVSETTTEYPAAVDPSQWSVQEVVNYATAAVNKTKGYTNTITVNHKEGFSCTISKLHLSVPAFEKAVKSIADAIIGQVVKPTEEVLTFNGGRTVNGEGENVPLLLPKRNDFFLDTAGVQSASARVEGGVTIVTITLKEEVGTLTSHPKYHEGTLGYLDASDVDISMITLNKLDIFYTGSTMVFTVNANGYVTKADYTIPIRVECDGKAAGVNAEVVVDGTQTENWVINW